MPSYTDIDGIPVTGDRGLLTGTLRDELGFDGVVVSDYNAISFLDTLHGIAETAVESGAIALDAGRSGRPGQSEWQAARPGP